MELPELPSKPLLRRIFSRRNVVGAVVAVGCRLAGGGPLISAITFVAARYVYGRSEQKVPFTNRCHVILLPTVAEVMLGQKWYDDFLSEASHKRVLLGKDHRDTLLVTGIAQRLIAALQQGRGGGYQKHLRLFQWQVSVVNEDIANAFVFSGGKIVVYTGLLDLMGRDKDLIAMVMGHEIAHALARHQSEKIGMGIAISLAASMALNLLSGGPSPQQQEEQRRRQEQYERMRRGYHRTHARMVDEREEQLAQAQWQQQAAQQQYAAGQAAAPSPDQLPGYLSEQLVKSLSSVLLELPFSRRAETEADLIGLKLMALAGFNPHKGPRAFQLLAEVGGGHQKHRSDSVAFVASLGCTHPDSQGRAATLQRELEWMAKHAGPEGMDAVGTKVDYWATGAELAPRT